MNELDKIAHEVYGAPFKDLSAFGQNEIRRQAGSLNPLNQAIGMHDVDIAQALANAQRKIATLELELRDVWEENEELKLQLIEGEDDDANIANRS